jgi:hypothetical protein
MRHDGCGGRGVQDDGGGHPGGLDRRHGLIGKVLATDPKDRLARALASLGRAFMARDS